jgi:hypothetical protein
VGVGRKKNIRPEKRNIPNDTKMAFFGRLVLMVLLVNGEI